MADTLKLKISTEGNLRFKMDWSSLIVGSELTVFALFYFVFEGNFPSTSPWEAYIILEGAFNGGFFCITSLGGLCLEGFIHGGAYFGNFTVLSHYTYIFLFFYQPPKNICLGSHGPTLWVSTVSKFAILNVLKINY